jgi:hypothetical protein
MTMFLCSGVEMQTDIEGIDHAGLLYKTLTPNSAINGRMYWQGIIRDFGNTENSNILRGNTGRLEYVLNIYDTRTSGTFEHLLFSGAKIETRVSGRLRTDHATRAPLVTFLSDVACATLHNLTLMSSAAFCISGTGGAACNAPVLDAYSNKPVDAASCTQRVGLVVVDPTYIAV